MHNVHSVVGNALLFFGWGNAQIALAFFISSLFDKSRAATSTALDVPKQTDRCRKMEVLFEHALTCSVFSYLLVIVGVVVALVLNETGSFHSLSLSFFLSSLSVCLSVSL